jgi:2'-5' RNA ligase
MLTNHWYWRPGWGVGTRYLIWYLTWEDHPEVRKHAARYREALVPLAELDVVPEEWLHATLQGVGHTRRFTEDQVGAVAYAAQRALAGCSPAAVRLDRPEPLREAVAFHLAPASGVEAIREATLRATIEALGADALQDPWPRPAFPHVSVAYVAADLRRSAVQAALDAVREPPVETVVRSASLVELHRDRRQYEWRTIAKVPIGPAPEDHAMH